MKVFILIEYTHSDFKVLGAYSTLDKALQEAVNDDMFLYKIEELEIDKENKNCT